MNIRIYQQMEGYFTVNWCGEDGRRDRQYFNHDLGGMISFAFGLKAGALARGEAVEVWLELKNPLLNRGFQEGFLRGINHPTLVTGDFDPAQLATDEPFPSATLAMPWLQELIDCLREAFEPHATKV